MRFIDYITMAFRNTARQRLRSGLTIFAIVIGALMVTIMLSLVQGAKSLFVSQINEAGGLTLVSVSSNTDLSGDDAFRSNGGGDSNGVKLTDATVEQIKGFDHVTSVTPNASIYALQSFVVEGDAAKKKHNSNGAVAYPAGPETDKPLDAGRNFTTEDHSGVVLIGASYLKKLGFATAQDAIGKRLIFTTQNGYSGEGATVPEPQLGNDNGGDQRDQPATEIPATIIGVVSSGPYDGNLYAPITWAKGLLEERHYEFQPNNNGPGGGTPQLVTSSQLDRSGYSTLVVKVDEARNVENVATTIKGLKLGVATAKEFLDTILRTFKVIGIVFGAIGGIALSVAAIGVINTMVMAMLERRREIGVMRACGASRGTVSRLFTIEAALLGFLGGFIGILLALGISVIANHFLASALASQHVSAKGLIEVRPVLALLVIAGTTLIGMLAGLYPARRAAKLDPVEALRYE